MTRRYDDVLAVIKSRITIDGDCWLFAGSDNGHGYQSVACDYAHRHMHRLCIGPIPDGYQVDHLCSRRACVNPAHLEAVTPAENKRRAFAAKTHCKHGHDLPPFIGEIRPCRECHRIREARRKQRIREGTHVPVSMLEARREAA